MYKREFLNGLSERLGDYLAITGRDTRKNFLCVNPDHEDHNPSMHYYEKLNKCLCFACGAKYDVFQLVGVDFGITDFKEQVEKASEIFNVRTETDTEILKEVRNRQSRSVSKESNAKDYGRFFAACRERIAETDYWRKRGLSKEIVKRAGLGYHPEYHIDGDGKTWRALVIPVDDTHYVIRNTDDADKSDRFRSSPGGRTLYTRFANVEFSDQPTFIVEGELDAISVADAGGESIALGSVQNTQRLLDYLSEHKPKLPIVLALDQDDAGRKAARELSDSLREREISFVLSDEKSMRGYKDANEFLQRDRQGFTELVGYYQKASRDIYELEIQFGKRPADSSR